MIGLLLRHRVDGLHDAGVLLATRIFSRPRCRECRRSRHLWNGATSEVALRTCFSRRGWSRKQPHAGSGPGYVARFRSPTTSRSAG